MLPLQTTRGHDIVNFFLTYLHLFPPFGPLHLLLQQSPSAAQSAPRGDRLQSLGGGAVEPVPPITSPHLTTSFTLLKAVYPRTMTKISSPTSVSRTVLIVAIYKWAAVITVYCGRKPLQLFFLRLYENNPSGWPLLLVPSTYHTDNVLFLFPSNYSCRGLNSNTPFPHWRSITSYNRQNSSLWGQENLGLLSFLGWGLSASSQCDKWWEYKLDSKHRSLRSFNCLLLFDGSVRSATSLNENVIAVLSPWAFSCCTTALSMGSLRMHTCMFTNYFWAGMLRWVRKEKPSCHSSVQLM